MYVPVARQKTVRPGSCLRIALPHSGETSAGSTDIYNFETQSDQSRMKFFTTKQPLLHPVLECRAAKAVCRQADKDWLTPDDN